VSAQEPIDVARLREAFASLTGEGPHPVDAERVFDAVHGRGTPEERQAVVDELLMSPAAAQAWRLAHEMAVETTTRTWMVPRTWTWMSVAAAAVLVVGLGWQTISSPPPEEPAYRRVETRTMASALPREAVLSRANPVLRWTGIDGAKYRVTVLTTDLEVLEESAELAVPEHFLSERTLERLRPGTHVFWQVQARLPGEAVVVSPTFSIRVP
jgi:hypothetical protein